MNLSLERQLQDARSRAEVLEQELGTAREEHRRDMSSTKEEYRKQVGEGGGGGLHCTAVVCAGSGGDQLLHSLLTVAEGARWMDRVRCSLEQVRVLSEGGGAHHPATNPASSNHTPTQGASCSAG